MRKRVCVRARELTRIAQHIHVHWLLNDILHDVLFARSLYGYMGASHVKAGYIPSLFHPRSRSALPRRG